MKNKLIMLAAALTVLLCAAAFQLAGSGWSPRRVHQHRLAGEIPELRLELGGQEIPGAPTAIEDENGVTRWQRYIHYGDLSAAGTLSYAADAQELNSGVLIHIRGNSSRYFDKKSYALHLVDEQGLDRDLSFSGMGEANEWALNGPWLDRTLIRNYMCMNIAGEIMDYAPDVRFVKLYIDGAYQGLYLLMETVTRDVERLNLTRSGQHDYVTSYIVKLDRSRPDVERVNTYTDYTLKTGAMVYDLCYPGRDRLSEQKKQYVERDLSRIERKLYSYDLTRRESDYTDDIDIACFAQYFVINEFFGNMDAGFYSTYLYKDTRGKVRACVWDFNNACDNYMEQANGTTGFHMQYAPWFERLIQDRRFVGEVIKQYRALRGTVLSDEYLQNYITETVAWLGGAVDENYALWDDAWHWEGRKRYLLESNYLTPAERNPASYEEAVEQLRAYLTGRGAWLDDNIENLRQYCHDSRTVNETMQ